MVGQRLGDSVSLYVHKRLKIEVVPPKNKQTNKKGKRRSLLPTVKSQNLIDRVINRVGLFISIKRYLQRCKGMSEKIKELRFILQCVIKRELEVSQFI